MTSVISKDEFISIIDDIKNIDEYHSALNKVFRKHNVDGYIFQPDGTASIVKLLHFIFGDKDNENYISKFVFDYNFGKTFNADKDTITNSSGNLIDLSNAEKLYEILTR